ncbi:MAG TPA: MBL fold metallo-hydrolase [Bryobacteraceae bacterium]|nr:MBL fold metallo-hydrolase [Bryobacteraceae bacterium]
MRLFAALILGLCTSALAPAAKTLDVYFIDVEGGQASLIVTPAGQSMLVDAGWPGFNQRDASRIAQAAKSAGVKHLDYLVVTHFHRDHVGGVPELVAKLPVKNFVDHGPNVETGKGAEELSSAYDKAVQSGRHIVVKPGDTIPLKGVTVDVVAANGEGLKTALPKGGAANSVCEASNSFPEDKTENARSVGFVLSFGKFRFVDLGDLTSRKEFDLVCPENRLGKVDVYLTTHHGAASSNAKAIVQALQPRVAIMNNGAKKGGEPAAWQIIRNSPGLEDLWQVHFAIAGGKENNVPEPMIANLEENCEGKSLKLSAMQDGSFTILNSRNKYQKTYPAR